MQSHNDTVLAFFTRFVHAALAAMLGQPQTFKHPMSGVIPICDANIEAAAGACYAFERFVAVVFAR